jgi:signal transduction histidine kinase
MTRRPLAGLDRGRLRLVLAFFFLALAVPAAILVYQAYDQLKWEAFHQYRTLAEELTTRIDGRISRLIGEEEARSYADYGFLVVAGDPAANFLQPSPLSAFPVASDIPGLLGYFQIDAEGVFSTPLVPVADHLAASYGISELELAQRRDLQRQIRLTLIRNRLVRGLPVGGRRADLREAESGELRRSTAPPSTRFGVASDDADRGSHALEAQSLANDKAEGQAAFDLLDLELVFSVGRLPPGPGARVLGWTAATLALVLCGGFLALDRLGRKQIAMARQQQDFVSAVSHELKTPLTSIRMYSEMLREGWAGEGRKGTYYAFICEESERLTRLITNVLQLARLTRNELRVDLKPTAVGELAEILRPKIASLTDRAGFALVLDCAGSAERTIRVDEDFLAQILINLVDNAVKFAREAERKEVRIACRTPQRNQIQLSVRDYGPRVARDQMKKIFKLFYRSGNELTRETVGTGIGLALVRELTLAMGGRVDLVNAQPGAEFRLTFPAERQTTAS